MSYLETLITKPTADSSEICRRFFSIIRLYCKSDKTLLAFWFACASMD